MVLKKLLGKIMTDMGFITEQQLDEVLQRQGEIFEQRALPEKVERAQLVSTARKAADRTPMLGQILMDMGYATEEQLEEALKEQDRITGVYGTIESAKLGAAIEIGSIVNSTLDLAEVLGLIMRYVNRVTNSVASTLMVLDDKTRELVFSVPTGPKAERLIDARLGPGKGIAGWVAEHGKPILVPNVREDPRFYAEIDTMSGFETQSILCVPLKAKTRLIGVLEAINKADGTSFTEEDELLLSIFAYQASMAIENARLYGELKNRLEEETRMHERLAEELAERRQAEKALRNSEERYRSVVEGSIEGIVVIQDFRVQFANQAAARIFGYFDPEELIGLDFIESFFAPQEWAELRSRASDILRRKSVPIRHGWQVVRKDGTPIWIQSAGGLLSWNNKPAILSFFIDITERRQAEQALRMSEEKYRLVVDNANEAIIVAQDGMLKFVNPKTTEITGYSAGELSSRPFVEFVHPHDRNMVLERHLKRLRGEKLPDVYPFRIIDQDGKIKWLEISAVLLNWEGRPATLNFLSDVTERKQAEEALRESEEKYRQLADSITDIFFAFDRELRYTYWNRASEELTGITAKDAIGKTFYELFPDTSQTRKAEKVYHKVLRTQQPHSFINEYDLAGRHYFFEISAYPSKSGLSVFVKDITERKRAEEELEKSREQLRNLAIHLQSVREGERTAIAREIHDDLGQALTGLKMDVSWLAKKLPRDQEPLLDKTKAMTELTDATIKTVKRISTELRPGLLDDLGLIPAIEWQADEFQNRTGITCALSVNPADIVLDRDRSTALFRIFQETLTNVARHAHATKVRVSLKEKNGIVELKVGDNGKGITEEQISDPKSFGLMGIRERVHPWRGTVKIKGAPDKGTTVTVSIPVEKSGELGN